MKHLTGGQSEVWSLFLEGLSQREIAERLGKSRRTVRTLLDRAKKNLEGAEDRDPGVQEAMDAFGLVSDDVERIWFKNKGLTVQAGVKRKKDEDFLDQVVEAFQDIPPAPPIQAPLLVLRDMMVVYPLFDVHLGLRAHATVSGEEMNLELGVKRVVNGISAVMAGAPAAYRAIIVNGGDFTHQTDDKNQTRRSSHILDVDGRNVFTVDAAIEVIATTIEMALQKHEVVEYYSVPGNHDPQNWETILIGLRERYRDHERVHIYCNWIDDVYSSEFAVIEHGQVALFIHHGDKRPPKDMVMFCMNEFREVFGRTRYNVLITGHTHHLKMDEFPGMYWWQLPAVTTRDAHAAGGYGSHSLISAIGFDLQCKRTSNEVIL